ncbi:hypothetical protein NW756_010175 [Fusarium oxysporum]|nr:hypothetical protein NW763_003703 [Fusarium oxysporum]KAJ4067821.1 hypothetical protein NW753_002883 [Fusarium oxysporum]KAJ4082486.1 hypothetical protein NW756_010175 [Fusarium oxysporum]
MVIDNNMASNTARTLHASDRANMQLGNNHNNCHNTYNNTYNTIDLTTELPPILIVIEDETSDETADLTEEEIIDLTQDASDPYMGSKRARDWDSDDHESKRLKFPDDTSESSSESSYDGGDSVDEDEQCEDGEHYVGLSTEDEGEENSDEESE